MNERQPVSQSWTFRSASTEIFLEVSFAVDSVFFFNGVCKEGMISELTVLTGLKGRKKKTKDKKKRIDKLMK